MYAVAWAVVRVSINLSLLTLIAVTVLYTNSAIAKRAIPDDNLAYPVLITLENGNDQVLGTASGFYLNTDNSTYLVTAKHAFDYGLPDPKTNKIAVPDLKLELLSYSKDLPTLRRNLLTVNFSTVRESGDVRTHSSHDVAVIKIETIVRGSDGQPSGAFTEGVSPIEVGGILVVSMQAVRTYDQVLVGNDAILYGYPVSLGLPDSPQFDPLRPLLRKALVAGQDPKKHVIIIDGAVYRGNSGGPVFEIDTEGFQTNYVLIGVLVEFIPLVEKTQDFNFLINSGYSVAEPMDFVLELIK